MQDHQHPGWDEIHANATVVDIHAHPSLKISFFSRALTARLRTSRAFDPFSVRTDFTKLKTGGLDILLSTVHPPERQLLDECRYLGLLRYVLPHKWQKVFGRTYFQVAMEMMDKMEERVRSVTDATTGEPMAKMICSVRELDELLAQGSDRPIGVIHNIEGAHALDGNLDNLDVLFERGVAYLTLAHFYENEAVHPCFPFPEDVQVLGCFQWHRDPSLGLKKFGEELIEKMIDLGIILDVTHSTPVARESIYEIVGDRAPIMVTHVGAYEINPSPYNLKDEEIAKISDSGGVVGVIFMNYWLMPYQTKRGLNFIARTINHLVDVAGIEHVAIGTDFDGFTDPPDDLKDASLLPRLTQRLIAEGYKPDQIAKIWGGNALRVLHEGWGKKM